MNCCRNFPNEKTVTKYKNELIYRAQKYRRGLCDLLMNAFGATVLNFGIAKEMVVEILDYCEDFKYEEARRRSMGPFVRLDTVIKYRVEVVFMDEDIHTLTIWDLMEREDLLCELHEKAYAEDNIINMHYFSFAEHELRKGVAKMVVFYGTYPDVEGKTWENSFCEYYKERENNESVIMFLKEKEKKGGGNSSLV